MSLPDPDHQPDFYSGVLPKRAVAWLIDSVLVTVLSLLFGLLTFGIGLFLFPAVSAVIGFLYRVGTLTGGSATWGMRFTGIELRQADGARFDIGAALLHTLGYFVSLAIFPLQLVSIVIMLLSDKGQGLTDLVLGSRALNRRAAAYLT